MSARAPKQQQGSTHLLLILAIIVIVLIIGAGWLVYTKTIGMKKAADTASTQNTAAASAAASAAKDTCNAKYHDSDLCKFVAAEAAHPFEKTSAVITMTGMTGGTQSTIVLSQDGKGNSELVTTGGGYSVDSITLDGVIYTKAAGETVWTKYASGASAPTTTTPDSNLSFLASLDSTQFTKAGTAACGGSTCFKYTFTDTANAGATQYALFDKSDYLMREYASTGGTLGNMDIKITYQKVTITMPSPVQDLSANLGQ